MATTKRTYVLRRLHTAVAALAVVLTLVVAVRYVAGSGTRTSPATGTTFASSTTATAALDRATAVDVYASTRRVRSDVARDVPLVYVPSGRANIVSEIDPRTMRIVRQLSTGAHTTPQHIVPSYDLRTLWVLDNKSDDVIPIDARTGIPGARIPVDDPYNMYFTIDGRFAIVVAELHERLDFRDPHTMALRFSINVPGCRGINHADFSVDGSRMIVTCEYAGAIAEVDVVHRRVVGMITLPTPADHTLMSMPMPDHSMASSMPQDVRLSPDGTRFYVADMLLGGVHVVAADGLRVIGFIPTGPGAHSITPSRDGRDLYVANRGSASLSGMPHAPGSVSVIDARTERVVATWAIPGGGSPDMGNLTADGNQLWLSGRFDREVYVFDTRRGALVARIAVPSGPHGLTVWPQPGRFSLGHTGNMR